MANTYSQIYIHLVFAPIEREKLIFDHFRESLHKFISGVIQNRRSKLLAINPMADHIHIFLGLNPSVSISEIVKEIKVSSTNFINKNGWVNGNFKWQEGYAAFSYSHSQISSVIKYIHGQQEHHKTKSFKDEYIKLLDSFNVQYNDCYLFK